MGSSSHSSSPRRKIPVITTCCRRKTPDGCQINRVGSVPVIIRDVNDFQQLEFALVENVQREDLSPLETAEAYRQLAEDFSLSHDDIAKKVGKSRVTITNTIRLLKLPEDVLQSLRDGEITEGHGRAILAFTSPKPRPLLLKLSSKSH